jgi:regulator of protease activity HflC (stomatin/prohibitin superfamily)
MSVSNSQSDARDTIIHSRQRRAATMNGGLLLLVALGLLGALVYLFTTGAEFFAIALFIPCAIALGLIFAGFFTLQPNEAAVITLFGNYKGTDTTAGLRWNWFFYARKKLSLRVRNVTSQTLKVNDKRGNPIEIAAVVVWRIVDTAQALFDVDNYEVFVNIQIETALREIASHFAYDYGEEHEPTLRADGEAVARKLAELLQDRVSVAGVRIDGAKLSHLAYSPEIAGAMLKRQQAEAVLAARAKIVQGAVEMVETALNQLSARAIVQLDDDRRAQMVSNLLVVLCADREVQPVVNTGTLHQ